MIRKAVSFFFLSAVCAAFAQDPGYLELVRMEAELNSLFNRLYADSLSSTAPVLDQIGKIMPEALALDGAMNYAWTGLDRIGVVTSDDDRIRVFTWHIMDDQDQYRYFGYIQVENRKDRTRVVELKDNQKPQRNLTNLDQSPEDWYGKLYYQIITQKHRRNTFYTLLGMDFNTSLSTIKTVETLTLQRNRPKFVKGMFIFGNSRMDRVVLEYSSQVTISVRYDPAIRMITFDHLEPLHPIYRNNYEFYGPDGSFDGLEFTDGVWIYQRDIDARNRD